MTSPRATFSTDIELKFLVTFGNSVIAEVSRLASIAADRQKGDFIACISHELRSPLHGILASAEFLSEAIEDRFQLSLVETVASCGRTLLDTIDHILDYTKIGSFERTWKRMNLAGKKLTRRSTQSALTKHAPPILSIFATVDVAALVEEVVEGVYASQQYQHIGSTDSTTFSQGKRSDDPELGINFMKKADRKFTMEEVDIVLDVTPDDYLFTTQPGALKRLVMNVVGNALKYTAMGTVTVKLSLEDIQSCANEDPSSTRQLDDRILQIRSPTQERRYHVNTFARISTTRCPRKMSSLAGQD